MQKLLTIVVPVYKVEQYINKCLDSCVIYKADGSLDEEKMSQLEVIIVNDGTPDNSAELSRVYTKRYPQTFRQIDKENGGHGSAWNVGLKEATGKYLRFLDSDDWLTNLDKLMEKLAETDADVVFTNRNDYFLQDNKYVAQNNQGPFDVIQEISLLNPFSFADHIGMCNFWFATYKTQLLKPCYPLFLEHVRYDDSILFTVPLLICKTYVKYNFIVYNYLLGREDQTTNKRQILLHLDERVQVYKYLYTKTLSSSNYSLNLYAVNHALAGQAVLLMEICSKSSFANCKRIAEFIPNYVPSAFEELKQSKIYNRYKKIPLWLFYLLSQCRILKAKMFSNS